MQPPNDPPDGARSRRWRPPAEPCLNCGDPTPGRFCPSCGQRKTVVQASISEILGDVVRDELVLNAALPRTLGALLVRPGHLTAEYVRGRIVRYIPPLRLYLVSSIVFFLVVSFLGLRALDRVAVAGEAALPADPDSARAELLRRQAELQAVDTAALPAAARVLVRQSLTGTEAALAALERGDEAPEQAAARARRVAGGGAPLPPGSLQPWAQSLELESSNPLLQRALDRRMAQLGHLPLREAVRAAASDLLDYAPHLVFLLLPVFALLLKLLYVRRGRYYAEHFVFALHVHAFFFVMFLIMLVLPGTRLDGLLVLWMTVYVWLAMKRVYGQGWFRTTVKWWVLGWSYFVVLTFGLLGLAVTTLLFA